MRPNESVESVHSWPHSAEGLVGDTPPLVSNRKRGPSPLSRFYSLNVVAQGRPRAGVPWSVELAPLLTMPRAFHIFAKGGQESA
jgi:hypothetical protein